MKTITFYSYKGGVGRSLALSKLAIRLSELNKKVCVLDFDLDAPGLRFKFKDYTLERRIEKGIVDYIHEFSSEGKTDHKISDFVINFIPTNEAYEKISFISAGDIDSSSYWKKLSMIRWADMFYGEDPKGVSFFLDLKSKIEREIAPDYFLIDSRTGITDISGITLRLLADQIVVLAVNNQENIFGSKKIIKNLQEKNFPVSPLKINFVLTRLPYAPTEIELENKILENLRAEFESELNIRDFHISVIHSDVALKMSDSYFSGKKSDKPKNSIDKDYLKLFDVITEGSLINDEHIKKIKEAELEFNKYQAETDRGRKFKHINRAIELNPLNYVYLSHRGVLYYFQGEFEKAIEDYKVAMRLNTRDATLPYNMAHFYDKIGEQDIALRYLDQGQAYGAEAFVLKSRILSDLDRTEEALAAISTALDLNPLHVGALNMRANMLRVKGDYTQAFIDISKAIEQKPQEPIFFGTLAEIYAVQNKIDEFYLNLSIALSKGLTNEHMRTAVDAYEKFKDDKRFIDLLTKYNIFVDDIMK